MDFQITEKALFAQTRVQQALEAGAHYIDADDVRELLDGKASAGKAYENRIAWLEDQLAKARASTGGSRELVAAAISIRDRLADYFRYVAEGLPLERAAEANERAQALINALGLLANDLEAGRLADQCTRLHRNQLLGELDEARAALDASQGQVKQLEAEVAELRDLADRQAGLLSRTTVAIRGPEPDLTRWSHHDLPERAQLLREQCDGQAVLKAPDASQGQARQLDDDFLEEYISLGFDVLTGPTIGLSARKACLQLAEDYGVSYRHVWRILKAAP